MLADRPELAERGLLVRLLIPRRGAAGCEIFQEINEALKQRVEAAAGSVDDSGALNG